jgi:deazaflavin-dependent oxidoreductase (nitroreductase family)
MSDPFTSHSNPSDSNPSAGDSSRARDPGVRYVRPGWFTRHVMNPAVARLVQLGVSMKGARELQVRGRTTGEWRTTPVNLLELDGRTYLVAPRGETQWVKNLRVAGAGRLRSGRRVDGFTAVELADDEKPVVLREYLRRWAWEVGQFFDGLRADSSDAEVAAAAAGFPVFAITID